VQTPAVFKHTNR